MNLDEIFENLIKIEPKVVSIETLFNNSETVKNTIYAPEYQRNYVWDDEKATYFIESILLGTEIPPIIYFVNKEYDKIEVIDGRQRYQTILRFITDQFKLKKSGLNKLDDINIGGKFFKDLGDLRDVFWDTKLRIIEFSFHTKNGASEEIEDKVKKEIFRRYNSGITPLKSTEIDKAYYLDNQLNSYFSEKLHNDKILYSELSDLFYFEKSNIQIILKKIRQLLVLHQIPIRYYAIDKENIIKKYFELLGERIEEEDISGLFSSFLFKINYLKKIRKYSFEKNLFYNRIVSESLFWAFSILEIELGDGKFKLSNEDIKEICEFIDSNKSDFEVIRSTFFKELVNRYSVTASFFANKFNISFDNYVNISSIFKSENKKTQNEKKHTSIPETSFEELRINKPEPSSITIVDICRQMEKHRFLLRPQYQRSEVINKKKSSAIIESILLGIKLPPIFVFKREDGISEVLDGQQRLLSILGFLKRQYIDENNIKQKSIKHGFSLSLKNGILKDLEGLNIDKLDTQFVKKINNYDLWIIEINQRSNKDFEPIDLFLRLNSKPYPIKENTFEMWNSYIDRDINLRIKSILNKYQHWFYFRKNNSRMENENVYTGLIYLIYEFNNNNNDALEYYLNGNNINFRIKSKNEITKMLDAPSNKGNILKACDDFENIFLYKLKLILDHSQSSNSADLNSKFDNLMNTSKNYRRSQNSFYALWYFLFSIPANQIINDIKSFNKDIKELFNYMNNIDNKDTFTKNYQNFQQKYNEK